MGKVCRICLIILKVIRVGLDDVFLICFLIVFLFVLDKLVFKVWSLFVDNRIYLLYIRKSG